MGKIIGTPPFKFYGPFGPADGQKLPVGEIRAPLGAGSFGIGVAPNSLTLKNPALAVRVGGSDADNPIQDIDLVIEADFEALRVSVGIPISGSTFGISAAPLPHDESINSLIEGLPGGQGFTSYIPSELSSIFANVGLDNFTMIVDLPPKVTSLSLSISTLEPWPVIPGILTLKGLSLEIGVVDPAGLNWIRILMEAKADFFPHIFTGEFDFTVALEKKTSWEVSTVSGAYYGSVNLGDIVGGFLPNQDSVPSVLRDIVFSDFGLSATKSGPAYNYTLYGSVEAAFPVLERELTAQLNLVITQADKGSTSTLLNGQLVIGEEVFTIALDLGKKDSRLRATWTTTGAPLEFGDIASAFGWDNMPAIPDNLDLSLTDAGFIYDFSGPSVILTATSKNYGQIVFVTEIVNGKRVYLLDLNVPLNVKLSQIPVAGPQIPSSIDVGIENLEIAYASAALDKDDIDAIDKELETIKASELGPPTLAQGLVFFGLLQLGTEQEALTLPLSSASTEGRPQTEQSSLSGEPLSVAAPAAYQASGKWFNIGKSFGPLAIDRIGVQYENSTLFFALDASIGFGPLALSMDGLAVGSPLTHFSPVFSLNGLGISYNKPPLQITGAVIRIPPSELPKDVNFQFDGTLVLKAETFSLSAIGSYAQLSSGASSLFVFAQLEAPLGGPPAFFVEGLMAGFGFNRALAIPGQDEVEDFPLLLLAQQPSPNQQPKPQDPTKVLKILEGSEALNGVTKAWISPESGEYWLAAGLEFTSFELIRSKALLIVEFGNNLEIALLGLSTLQLPQPEESLETYAYVEMMIRVVIEPSQGFFAATAILSKNSFVITPDCHITGGFAFYLWFGSNAHAGEFVTTLGGYHPAFKAPDYYPQVPRLGFNWAVSDIVSVKGEAYFALTPSCIMAGGGLEVLFHDGDLQAWYIAHADFLVAWRPFFYSAHIDVSIGVSYRLNLIFCHKTVTLSLGASLELWGPPTGGIVRIDLTVVSFSVAFGSDGAGGQNQTPLGWKDFETLLPDTSTICRITPSSGLYKTFDDKTVDDSINSSGKLWFVRATEFSFSTQSAIPASHLQYGDGERNLIEVSAGGINIRPMNLSGVASTHTLKIYQGDANNPIEVTNWTLATSLQNVPESLWGSPPSPFTQTPGQPTANVIAGKAAGYSVAAPIPEPGTSRGVISLSVLLEDEITPAGQAPLSTAVAPSPDYVPAVDQESVGLIQKIMDSATHQSRDSLFAVLSGASLFAGSNGSLSQLAAKAAHIYSDSPMLET